MLGYNKYIYKNKGSMVAILDFTRAATDTKLKMFSVQLLTSKCMFRHTNRVSIIFISCDVNKYIV